MGNQIVILALLTYFYLLILNLFKALYIVNRVGGLSLPRKSEVRIAEHPDITIDVNRGRKTMTQQQNKLFSVWLFFSLNPESWALL